MNALLLSAGLGTRFRPATEKIAKPAIPFLNVPLIGYSIFYLEQLGLKNLVMNTHHLPSSVESVARELCADRGYSICFSHEPEILGSGGGIKQAESYLAGGSAGSAAAPFIVANADEVMLFAHERGWAPLLEFHRAQDALATLLTTDHSDAGRALGGVWADSSGRITKLGGQGDAPGAKHFTGVYIFSPRVFSYMPAGGEFHIFTDVLHKAMAAGEKVLSFHDPDLLWLDSTSEKHYVQSTSRALELLNSKPDSPAAKNLFQILARFGQGVERVSNRLWLGAGAKCDVSAAGLGDAYVFLGKDSHLGPDVQVKGFAVLGPDAQFTQGYIENSVLASHLHVHPVDALRNQLVI